MSTTVPARKIRQIRRTDRKSSLGVASADRQKLRLAHRPIDIDRVDLDNGCECGRSWRSDEIADIDLMIGDDAVEGGKHSGETEVDVRGFNIGFVKSNGGLVLLDDEDLVLCLLPCNWFLLFQRLVALQVDLRFRKHSLVLCQLRFCLIELRLIGVALDEEELRPLLDRGAIRIVDRFQIALDAGGQIRGSERRGVTGQINIQR
jgi:hypothetical protein